MSKYAAGNLRDRIILQRRSADENGDRLGDWEAVASGGRDGAWSVQIIRLKGGEPVMQQRLQGVQPVILVLRAASVTRALDNTFRAVDVRDRQVYEFTAPPSLTDDRAWVEVLATAKAGDLAP